MYYRNANCAVVVYDITQPVSTKRPLSETLRVRVPCLLATHWPLTCLHLTLPPQQSLEKAKSWISELHRQADPNIIIALAGNKADLASTRRAVPTEEAQRYAEEEKLLFLETSAKDSSNVSELFTMIARKLPLEQAASAQRRSGGAGGAAGGAGAGRTAAGVDLRGGQGGQSGGQDACNC